MSRETDHTVCGKNKENISNCHLQKLLSMKIILQTNTEFWMIFIGQIKVKTFAVIYVILLGQLFTIKPKYTNTKIS